MDSNYKCILDEYKVIKLDKTDYNFISFINDSNGFDENAISLPLLSSQDIDRFSKEIKAMKQDKSIKGAMNEIYKYLLGESNDLDLQFQKEKDKAEKTGKKVGVQIGMKAGKKAERIKIAKRMLIDDMKIYKGWRTKIHKLKSSFIKKQLKSKKMCKFCT